MIYDKREIKSVEYPNSWRCLPSVFFTAMLNWKATELHVPDIFPLMFLLSIYVALVTLSSLLWQHTRTKFTFCSWKKGR
jgi:hypothetical protein